MAHSTTPGTYRTNTEIMSRRGGVFWGLVLLLFGVIWLLQALGAIVLPPNVMNAAIPLLLVVAGMYLLVVKLMR